MTFSTLVKHTGLTLQTPPKHQRPNPPNPPKVQVRPQNKFTSIPSSWDGKRVSENQCDLLIRRNVCIVFHCMRLHVYAKCTTERSNPPNLPKVQVRPQTNFTSIPSFWDGKGVSQNQCDLLMRPLDIHIDNQIDIDIAISIQIQLYGCILLVSKPCHTFGLYHGIDFTNHVKGTNCRWNPNGSMFICIILYIVGFEGLGLTLQQSPLR